MNKIQAGEKPRKMKGEYKSLVQTRKPRCTKAAMLRICQEQMQDQATDVEQADKLTKSEEKVFPETQENRWEKDKNRKCKAKHHI